MDKILQPYLKIKDIVEITRLPDKTVRRVIRENAESIFRIDNHYLTDDVVRIFHLSKYRNDIKKELTATSTLIGG